MAEQNFVSFEKRGIIRVGGARMVILDILGGFNSIYRAVAEFIGPVASRAMYNAGFEGGASFTSQSVDAGMITKDEKGFLGCLDAYSQAGFGNFSATEVDFSMARASMIGKETFEVYNAMEHKIDSTKGVCNYTKGVLSSFLSILSGRDDLVCVETMCEAGGNPQCEYKIAPREELKKEGYIV